MVVTVLRSVMTTVMAEVAVTARATSVVVAMVMVSAKRVHGTQLFLANSSTNGGIPRGHALDEA